MTSALQTSLITDQIAARPRRRPNHAAENRALRMLAEQLADPSGDVLVTLCEQAMALCHAHFAGVSLIQFDGTEQVFRWHAIAGAWAGYVGGGLPRRASPCGVVVDRDATQLMHRPARAFPLVANASPDLVEALLAPFRIDGQPAGTVWVLSHDEARKFDAEDARIVESLASFAAIAFMVRDALDRSEQRADYLSRSRVRLGRTVARLAKQDPAKKS